MRKHDVEDVILRGRRGVHRVPFPYWIALVNLAGEYGWQASPESESDRPEALCELVLGRVTEADARALADALRRSLADLPGHDALSHCERGLNYDPRCYGGPFLSCPPSLWEWFSGPNKRRVRDLIAFARRGAFTVQEPDF